MRKQIRVGQTLYAGFPSAFVYNFYRNRKKKLVFEKVKHLLWGDWVKVTAYSYLQEEKTDTLNTEERQFVNETANSLIPVRVRGVSGYMYRSELQNERLLEIVFVDVGQGDGALLVTPDDKKYVIDAGIGENMFNYLRWRFADFKKTRDDFEGLIITHPDKDHYHGFVPLIDHKDLRANNIWHNGLVEQFPLDEHDDQYVKRDLLLGPKTVVDGQAFLTGVIETDTALTEHLSVPDRWIKKTTGKAKLYPQLLDSAARAMDNQGKRRFPNIRMLSTAHGEIVDGKSYLPGYGPNNRSGCVVEVIGPVVEKDAAGRPRLRVFTSAPVETTRSLNTGKTKNGHSILLKLKYRDVSILFGGDLNSSAEMFLLQHYTGERVYDSNADKIRIVNAGRYIFGVDIAKACHHGSADFTDVFLACLNPAATVISSGDAESHAHPRSDTLGALGYRGRGSRPLIFSTELARSTREFTHREDSPWYRARKLESRAQASSDPHTRQKLLNEAEALNSLDKKRNVTVYGSINLRSDGDRVVLAYMLEKPSRGKRWDVYPLGRDSAGVLRYLPDH